MQILAIFLCPQTALFLFHEELILREDYAWIFHKQSSLWVQARPIPFSLLEVLKLQPEVAQLLEQYQPSGNRYISDKGQDDLH